MAKRTQSARARAASLRNLKKARAARRGTTTTKRRRRNPTRAKRRQYSRTATMAQRKNPAPRRRRAPAAPRARPRARRRNPTALKLEHLALPTLYGTGGALLNDAVFGQLGGFLPPALQGGVGRIAVKGATAVALGILMRQVATKPTADKMTVGALTVLLHEQARAMVATAVPHLKLDGMGYYVSGMGYYNAGLPVGGDYQGHPGGNDGMGLYVSGRGGGATALPAGPGGRAAQLGHVNAQDNANSPYYA